jgi:hypothetical protein
MRDRLDKGELSMKKRLLPFLVLAVILVTAPAAMADHCRKCKTTQDGLQICWIAVSGGYPFCDASSGSCVFSGQWCTGPHPFTDEEPLAADFTVASVERLDEAQPAKAETRVASLQTTSAVND